MLLYLLIAGESGKVCSHLTRSNSLKGLLDSPTICFTLRRIGTCDGCGAFYNSIRVTRCVLKLQDNANCSNPNHHLIIINHQYHLESRSRYCIVFFSVIVSQWMYTSPREKVNIWVFANFLNPSNMPSRPRRIFVTELFARRCFPHILIILLRRCRWSYCTYAYTLLLTLTSLPSP